MSDPVIEERIDIASEEEAQENAQVLRDLGWTVEVEQQDDGKWMFRAYPPDFGSTEPAKNPKDAETPPTDDPPIPPPAGGVKGLLDFIARFESGGNYNAYFRRANNSNDPRLTSMLLSSVVDWQRNYVRSGSPSSAAGRYQIIRKTLQGLIRDNNLDARILRFNADVQDTLAVTLLKGRGLEKFQAGSLSVVAFAKNVAMEWASMPVLAPTTGHRGQSLQAGQSYYAGDGLNKSLVGIASYRRAIEGARS